MKPTLQKLCHAVAQVVEALRHSRSCHWNFSLTTALGSTQPLTEMSTRCVGLTNLPPSSVDSLNLGTSRHPQGPARVCTGIDLHLQCRYKNKS